VVGGDVIDETAIQQNLEIAKNGDTIKLVKFEDVGEDGEMYSTMRKGHQEKTPGTHILQFMFLGVHSFRFPFAHFVSSNVQTYDLNRLFWEAVTWLKMYGFTARYVSLDGAQTNRTFMNMNVGKSPSTMLCENPTPYDPSLVFVMDLSHVIKKLEKHTEKWYKQIFYKTADIASWVTDSVADVVHAFHWERDNARQLHRKPTNEHLFPSSQTKMRNKHAEDVLNSEILNLMSLYRDTLQNPNYLDGAF